MICPKCSSNNVNVQMVTNTYSKKDKRSCFYWVIIGWWLELFLWIFLTLPRLLLAVFLPKRQKIVSSIEKIAVCQNCGNSWNM